MLFSWGAFWFALAVWVNSRGGASAKNALTLVGFWLVFVVVLPGISEVVVDTLYPPPSHVELLHEAREAAQAVEEKLNALEGRHDIDPKKGATAQAIVEVQEALLERSEPVLAEVREQNLIRNVPEPASFYLAGDSGPGLSKTSPVPVTFAMTTSMRRRMPITMPFAHSLSRG